MPFFNSFSYFLSYFIKKPANQFFLSVAIRGFAIGMIFIFEPIYLYNHFNSISLTLLFFAAAHGIYALFAYFSGKIMAKIGFDWSISTSHIFYLSYFLLLLFIENNILFIFLAILVKGIAMALFWPSFHTTFLRFSRQTSRGAEVGKNRFAILAPSIAAPAVGGWIVSVFGYTALFLAAMATLFVSAIPLFMTRERLEVYSDSFTKAWRRLLTKKNRKNVIAFGAQSIELGIDAYIWPIFMAVISITYASMGGITSFSILLSGLLAIYFGGVCDTSYRPRLLSVGAGLTAISWLLKFFVASPFSALLGQSIYKMSRVTANVPFQTFFYEKAEKFGEEGDEFIISRSIIMHLSEFVSLIFFAILFALTSHIQIAFIFGAIFSLGFVFLGKIPKVKITPFGGGVKEGLEETMEGS